MPWIYNHCPGEKGAFMITSVFLKARTGKYSLNDNYMCNSVGPIPLPILPCSVQDLRNALVKLKLHLIECYIAGHAHAHAHAQAQAQAQAHDGPTAPYTGKGHAPAPARRLPPSSSQSPVVLFPPRAPDSWVPFMLAAGASSLAKSVWVAARFGSTLAKKKRT